MKIVISRRYRPNETTGKLIVFDQDNKVCELVTLELPDRGNQINCSCIPEGTYTINKITRPNGKPAFLLLDVPGRSSIEIHVGNYTSDILGCILPGLYLFDLNSDGELDIAESNHAMEKLLNVLPDESTLIII